MTDMSGIKIKVYRVIETEVGETYTVSKLPEDWNDLSTDEQFDWVANNSTHNETNYEEVEGTLRVHAVEVE